MGPHPGHRLKRYPWQVSSLSRGHREGQDCPEHTGMGRAERSGTAALIPPRLPGPLSFVQVEMKTNRYWMAGQKSCKRLGLAHPHVQALLSGTIVLGTGPEKALLVQGRYGVEHNDSSHQTHALSGPWPPGKETLNEVLEWRRWQGELRGAALLLSPQAAPQAQREVVCPLGPRQRAWEADLGPFLCKAATTTQQALPASSPKSHLPLTKTKNK